MGVHHHGYTWIGSGAEYGRDVNRRPGGTGFQSSTVPPLEPAHWLIKPPKLIKATFADAESAVTWYAQRIREHADRFDSPHARTPETIALNLEGARERVAGGRDVAVGWWMNGGTTFYSIMIVSCPNFWRPEHPCPKPPTG